MGLSEGAQGLDLRKRQRAFEGERDGILRGCAGNGSRKSAKHKHGSTRGVSQRA